jgi:hypothetical protein
VAQRLQAHRHQIVVVPLSLLPSHCCRPIVVAVIVDIIVVVVIVAAAIAVHVTFVVVAIVAAILVVGVAVVAVTGIASIINTVALMLLCLSYSSAVNPRNSTKASQCSITRGMLMERLPLGWP